MISILTTFAAETPNCDKQGEFFTLPTWYKYLDVTYSGTTRKCEINFTLTDPNTGAFVYKDIVLVGLGIIDILIRIAALVALFFVMYGGIKYTTSQGSPEGTKSAQNTIQNALVGLVVAVVASVFVAFVGTSIK